MDKNPPGAMPTLLTHLEVPPSPPSPSSSAAYPASPNVEVLIPNQYPGAFYYPPCKCDIGNQVRYFNPKTREFYYHTVATPADPSLGDFTTPAGTGSILAGEPEHFAYPNPAYPPYTHHMMLPAGAHPGLTGPYMTGPRAHESPYPVPVVPMDDMGVCEAILVCLTLLLWVYSFYRLYLVWQRTLNFSEASIQGPQGWDLLVHWVMTRIQKKKVRVFTNIRKKSGVGGSSVTGGASEVPGTPANTPIDKPGSTPVNNSKATANDLEAIEICSPSDLEEGRGGLGFRRDSLKTASPTSSSMSSFQRTANSLPTVGPIFGPQCSLDILHETGLPDLQDLPMHSQLPPAPLAAFGSHKYTAGQMRRNRLRKQYSEDIRDTRPRSGALTYTLTGRFSDRGLNTHAAGQSVSACASPPLQPASGALGSHAHAPAAFMQVSTRSLQRMNMNDGCELKEMPESTGTQTQFRQSSLAQPSPPTPQQSSGGLGGSGGLPTVVRKQRFFPRKQMSLDVPTDYRH